MADESTPRRLDASRSASDPDLVVGIGASAGGIGALGTFFHHVEPGAGISYVVILHLSPHHESRLAEVLQSSTRMPVTQVRETVAIEPDHVYVIPPNKSLQVVDAHLVLSPMTSVEERRAPVDVFFRTLADAYRQRAAAVVLSGTGRNGSSGLKRVKEGGGLAIAQDPHEAEFADMAANAIATGLIDLILPVAAIPRRIAEYARRLRPARGDDEPATPIADDGGPMRELMTLLRARTGHDFSNYKAATIGRRIERRMAVHAVGTLTEYVQFVREQSGEAAALMKDLLIGVTSFFRDPSTFDVLQRRVIGSLFEGKRAADQVRAWCVGCATGEEAYSLAMLLLEQASRQPDSPSVQIFATDLDEQTIAAAREGLYSEADVADIAPERLQRFFEREVPGYRVRRELRETILFAHHNVIGDPPFSHLDLITCRNLLIYLNRTVQEQVIDTFHFALRPGGFLFLGGSESVDGAAGLFVPVDKTAHLYESRGVIGRPPLPPIERPASPVVPPRRPEDRTPDRVPPGELHLRLLEQFAAPSLVVTDEHMIVHASDRVGRYLVIAGGEPSRDVLKLVRPELRDDLRTALRLAAQQREHVEVRGARVRGDGGAVVNITVRPVLREGTPAQGYFLVLFDEEDAPPSLPGVQLISPTSSDPPHLQEEPVRVREQLRMTVEQYESDADDAKAANEELQAMNEELRSAAEELETSQEELQSVNEELRTVNQELKITIEELGLTNNDFQNLINATDIGAIFLDKSQRVKLSTPRAQEIFNLLPSDVGRRLSDITSRLDYAALHDDVTQVQERLQSVERQVAATDGKWYVARIMPYRTIDDRIEGVALTFQDVTARREAERRMRISEDRLRALIESAVDFAIFTMNPAGRIESWNPGAERIFGYHAVEIIGQSAEVLFTPEDRAAGVPAQELRTARLTGRAEDDRWHLRKDGSRFYCSGVTTAIGNPNQGGFAKIARDLTARREADAALQRATSQLELRVHERTAELRSEVTRSAEAQERVTMLLRRLVTAQEDERRRIARDLHDHLGQQLTALRMTLERHREQCAAGDGIVDIDRALAAAREIDAAVDFLAWELRPAALDDLGLAKALPRYLEEWSAHCGVTAHYHETGAGPTLSRDAEVVFYRVAQESLNNVLKHAHASRVDVLLERRDSVVTLVIEDDGIGFDPADALVRENGVGLAGMQERAALIDASLQIESAPGKGTTMYLKWVETAAREQA
jgi:two-component system CheB/CheR fusion protein